MRPSLARTGRCLARMWTFAARSTTRVTRVRSAGPRSGLQRRPRKRLSSSRSCRVNEGERITVGRVGKSHGLDGSFVVEDASEVTERFEVGSELYVAGDPARVVGSKRARGRPVIRLDRRGAARAGRP